MTTPLAPSPSHFARPDLRWLRLAEPPPDPLSEADLSQIWAGQRFPPEALTTPDGRAVRVLNPGRLNSSAGPDFHDAIVELDGSERRGDVELHIRASYFRVHGHDVDPAYDGIALHVVYLADEGPETLLSDGSWAPVAAFAPWLERRKADLERWLASPSLWQEPCRDAALRLGDEAVAAVLRAAGDSRLRERIRRFEASITALGAEEALWQALLDYLGAGSDRDGFRRLSQTLSAADAAWLCSGASGRAIADRLEDALLAVASLRAAPAELEGCLPPGISPSLRRSGRPLNSPERRLRALALLFARAGGHLHQYAIESVANATAPRQLLAAWTVAGERDGPALLGSERAQELVVNAVLPWAAALRPDLLPQAEALLAALKPAGAYGKTAFLEANLRRSDGRRRVGSAVEQQGLLALLGEWCSRGGCGRCPLS